MEFRGGGQWAINGAKKVPVPGGWGLRSGCGRNGDAGKAETRNKVGGAKSESG